MFFTSFAVILMKKIRGYPEHGGRVSRQSPRVVATWKYAKSPFWKISAWHGPKTYRPCYKHFPLFISKKTGWNSDIWIFFSEKIQFMPLFRWKSTFSGRPCFITSLWRHTLTDFHDFGINGKRRPFPILWYQTTILWVCQFQIHRGVVTTP